MPNCPFYYVGAKLSGAKLSVFTMLVPNCPGAKLSGAKLSIFIMFVPNCPVPNCPGAKFSWCQIVRCQIVLPPLFADTFCSTESGFITKNSSSV